MNHKKTETTALINELIKSKMKEQMSRQKSTIKTLVALSLSIEKSRNYLSSVLNLNNLPRMDVLYSCAYALGCSVHALMPTRDEIHQELEIRKGN
ncbi:MAG: hypothetical protein U9Q62_08670 [Campylobacterota bacterium]|nr:hypothetical protein [Campylobacterota bacterium]